MGCWAPIQKVFCSLHKVMRSPKLDDVTKVAACNNVARAKLGWVGEINISQLPNFKRFRKLVLN